MNIWALWQMILYLYRDSAGKNKLHYKTQQDNKTPFYNQGLGRCPEIFGAWGRSTNDKPASMSSAVLRRSVDVQKESSSPLLVWTLVFCGKWKRDGDTWSTLLYPEIENNTSKSIWYKINIVSVSNETTKYSTHTLFVYYLYFMNTYDFITCISKWYKGPVLFK